MEAALAAIARGDRQAGVRTGRYLIDAERWRDARRIYDELVRRWPSDLPVRYGHGTVLLAEGRAEAAEQIFDALVRSGHDLPEIRFMRARARIESGKADSALDDLKNAFGRAPADYSFRLLASLYWMRSDREAFDELVARTQDRQELAVSVAEVLRQSGNPSAAVAVIDRARRKAALPPDSWTVVANAHIDNNDARAAEEAARAGQREFPALRNVKGALVSALLMQGRADDALKLLAPLRRAEPDAQHWLAYEATALRLLGDPRYAELVDYRRFVRDYRLEPPAEYPDLATFNAAMLEALEAWHPFRLHPLDQTLRLGSQTPRDLMSIDEPVFRAFAAAIDAPIRDYLANAGSDDGHPLTRRNTGEYRIAGCWSVRLHGGGWHINHVHPEGWISSAYYVSVPENTGSAESRAGWIKFGEPPFPTEPATPPEHWVCPEPGLLVLFPSFLWHGTEPIDDDATRVTTPFDAVPA